MNTERTRETQAAFFRVSPGSGLLGRAGLALSLLLALIVTMATPAMAQTTALNFSDPLTGPTSPYLTIDPSKYTYGTSGLIRTQSASGTQNGIDRPMVKTVSGGFLAGDFEFDVDVTAPATNTDIAFVGFGQGATNTNYNNEPTNAFLFRIHNNIGGNAIQADEAVDPSQPGSPLPQIYTIGTYQTGVTATFRIVRSGNSVTLSVPSIAGASHTFLLSDVSSLNSTNAYLFFGNTAVGTTFSNFRIVRAADTTPPVISKLTATPARIWPPNHKMVPVTLDAVATDNVGVTALKIVSVTSRESRDRDRDRDVKSNDRDNRNHEHDGDGARSSDYMITGDLTLKLRAEGGNIYTITVNALDAAGNAATKSVTVSVPKDEGLSRYPF